MLRVVERTYYQQEEIKTLDSRIREAGVNTYSKRLRKNTVNPTTITGETLRPTSIT